LIQKKSDNKTLQEVVMKRKFIALYLTVSMIIVSLCIPMGAEGQQVIKEVVVTADGTGDFTTVTGALNSITDASKTNRYRIQVSPGTYNEKIMMKSHVDISGSGQEKTTLTYEGKDPTIEWDAESATLSNLTITGDGTPAQVISIIDAAVIRNVKVVIPGQSRTGIYAGKGSSLEVMDSRIVFDRGRSDNVFGISTDGDSLSVTKSVIEMNIAQDTWSVGIYAERARQATISDTAIKVTGYGYGVMSARETEITGSHISVESSFTGKPDDSIGIETRGQLKIIHSLITVKTTNTTKNTTGVNVLRGNTTIEKSTVSSSLYGIDVHDGNVNVNTSKISGESSSVRKSRRRDKGSFSIVDSILIGEHDGVKGTDKIINCHDQNNTPIPNL
jgi:hypothetical protein